MSFLVEVAGGEELRTIKLYIERETTIS